ncbi:MAG: zinc ribbon domain-containing protein [Desulfurivibrionaceae bacterium]
MPIYEYKCSDCKTNFEVIANNSGDDKDLKCVKCGSARVKKTISASSFRISSGRSSVPAGALSGCASKSGFS